MSVVAGIKIKTKVPKVRGGNFADEKYTGSEPQWDTERAEQFDNATFDHHLRRSFYYYNYYYSQKDCKKYVVEWMQAQPSTFTKKDVSAFIRSSDRNLSMTACSLVMAHRQGMPFRGRHIEFLVDSINKAITLAAPEEVEVEVEAETVNKPYVPTIQDRLTEKTREIIGEIEGKYDLIVKGEKIDFKPYDYLVANNVVQSQLGKYEAVYTKYKAELEQARSKENEQLTEGYSHLKAADFKRIIAWIDSLLAAVEQYRDVKRATKKSRIKKAPSKEKVIARLKYAKDNKELKIVSINPADIVGASELWVYNVKTRKLGKYVADEYKTLSVKGTSIINFSERNSTSKTLRKPEEKLKEFAKAGKIQLRKFLSDIKATETLLNGRISTDVVLLRVL
jgi:hypothetical protein